MSGFSMVEHLVKCAGAEPFVLEDDNLRALRDRVMALDGI